jgi:endonuclease/exonuclease/phosphatase family metal-dependent hydrolase
LFQFSEIAGPRGIILVFNVMLDWRLDLSHVRRRQTEALCAWIRERRVRGAAVVVCGDFNAAPDSDEIRVLTGKSGVPQAGLVFYDAWDSLRPDERGFTWSNSNPYASSFPLPDRRIDYIFSAWGAPRGLGQPRACGLMGTAPGRPASDHFGVWADLRY